MAGRPALRVGPRWMLILLVGSLLATILAAAFPRSVLDADVRLYVERIEAMFSGGLPYVETSFEHYPLSVIPMLIARLVGGADYGTTHLFVFALQMLVLIAATGVVVDGIGQRLGDDLVLTRWMFVTMPLLPLVLFRVDPVSVVFVALALAGLMAESPRATGYAILGVAAKGWPGVLAPVAWWQGNKRAALAIAGSAGVITALLLATPGFREGRGFEGIHLETVAGSFAAWFGALGDGADLLTAAGATYVRGPGWMILLNLVLGVGLVAYSRIWKLERRTELVPLVGALATAVLLVVSPLFSAQFLLWMTPFLAFVKDRWSRGLFIAASVVTIALGSRWDVFAVWWHTGLVLRNALFVACAVALAHLTRRGGVTEGDSADRVVAPV